VPLALAIILLSVPARPQSAPSSQVSANDLARRVITNELTFQDDHTNWMYRLEKEQAGKKRVEEIIETKEGSLSRLLSIDDRPLSAKQIGPHRITAHAPNCRKIAITLIGLQTVVLRDIARLQPLFVYSFRPQQV
jgi:hypothetical protein